MTNANPPTIPGLGDDTGLDTRLPPFDLGRQTITIDSIRYHQSSFGNPDGIMTEGVQDDGSVRAFRINLGGKLPKYGAIDAKRLYTAAKGVRFDDPAAAAITAAEVMSMYAANNPMRGRRIEIEAFDSDKINPKTGRPYRNVRVIGPGAAGGAPPSAIPSAAPAAPPPPPPPPAPAAPAPAAGPPAGWFEFSPGDPRHATHYYNAAGETRAK